MPGGYFPPSEDSSYSHEESIFTLTKSVSPVSLVYYFSFECIVVYGELPVLNAMNSYVFFTVL